MATIKPGYERISMVNDDRYGTMMFQIETADGNVTLCDCDGDVINDCSSWTLQRVLGDIPAGDADGFHDLVSDLIAEATRKLAESN